MRRFIDIIASSLITIISIIYLNRDVDIYKVKASVVSLKDTDGNILTGVLIKGGYVLTVLKNVPVIFNVPTTFTELKEPSIVHGTLAKYKVNIKYKNYATIGKKPKQGQEVYIIGTHFNFNRLVAISNVGGYRLLESNVEVMIINKRLSSSSIGSGVFNRKGELVAIVTKVHEDFCLAETIK